MISKASVCLGRKQSDESLLNISEPMTITASKVVKDSHDAAFDDPPTSGIEVTSDTIWPRCLVLLLRLHHLPNILLGEGHVQFGQLKRG
jgi:hypothetical protein